MAKGQRSNRVSGGRLPFPGSVWLYPRAAILKAVRVTTRQLQWWDRVGVVPAVKRGRRRFYTHEDALALLLVGELRSRGMSFQRVRPIIKDLRSVAKQIACEEPHGLYLLTDGRKVFVGGQDDIIGSVARARVGALVISLGDLAMEIPCEIPC